MTAARRDNLDPLRTAIDADKTRLCLALGMEQDGARFMCPFCQSAGKPKHKTGDYSLERGFVCQKCEQKGDGFDLIMEVRKCDFKAAVAFARDLYGIRPDDLGNGVKRSMLVKNPEGKAEPTKKSGKKTHPDIDAAARAALWTVKQRTGADHTETRRDIYEGADGHPVAAVLRFDRDGAIDPDGKPIKTFIPVHAVKGGWRVGDPPGKWPLFNLPAIVKASGPVFVVEGEKAACAGASIGLLCTTSAHGAKSPAKTDWTPLQGREVVILPDNDPAGMAYAETVAGILESLQ